MVLRWKVLSVGLAAAALAVAGCGGGGGSSASSSGSPANGGPANAKVVVGTDAEPTTLDTQLKDDDGKDFATWRINEGIVDFDKQGKLIPDLATALPEQIKPTVWRAHLVKGVKFTNGEPFDADAVVANVKRILDKKYGSTFAAELATLDHAQAVDRYTVDFITKEPDPIFLYRLRTLRIVPPKAAEQKGYAQHPIGTGPYEFVSWHRGSDLTIRANPDYRGQKPQVTEVVFKFIPDAATRLRALQAGEIDIASNIGPEDMGQVPKVLVSDAPTETSWIRINTGIAPYSDIRFREALNYAIDKKALSDKLFGGVAEPANCQLTPPQAGGTNSSLQAIPYDPAKARQLLQQSGAAGMTLPLEWAVGVYPRDREFGEAVAGMLEAVGLKVKIHFNEVQTFIDKFYAAGPKSPPLFYGQTDNSLNHASRQLGIFYSSKPIVGSALGAADQKTADGLVDKALGAQDDSARKTAYDQFQKWQCDQRLFVYLLFHKQIYGLSKRVEYQPGARGVFPKMYFDEMRVTG